MAPKKRKENGLTNSRSRETSAARDTPPPAAAASKKGLALNSILKESNGQMYKWTQSDTFRTISDLSVFKVPTKIYHLLMTRQKLRPLFLHRTLSFMNHRASRRRKRRTPFDFDEFVKRMENSKKSKFPKPKYMTITFLGYYDSNYVCSKTIKVETSIVKARHSKRKDPATQKTTLSLFTGEVPVNAKDDESPQVPIISISPDTFNSIQNCSEMSYTLGVRVTRDTALIGEVGTEKAAILEGFLQVFDNTKCVLLDGQYDMRLYDPKRKPAKASVWVPLDGLAIASDESSDIVKGPMIRFKLQWTSTPSSGWVERPSVNPDQKNGPASQSSVVKKIPNLQEGKMVYRFLNGQGVMLTDMTDMYQCPWCDLHCGAPYPLFKHQRLSHPRLNFAYTELPKQAGYRVEVTMNPLFAGSCSDDVVSDGARRWDVAGPHRRTVVTEVLVCRPKRPPVSLAEFIDSDALAGDKELQRPTVTGHNRIYHHTKTCLPIQLKEMDEDSEGEKDPEWLRQKTISMIDDFTDVNEGEKELMKMWNLHVLKHGYVGDCQIPNANLKFVDTYGDQVIKQNLYRNFLLHLCNQFDFGLLSPTKIFNIVLKMQERMHVTGSNTLSAHWLKQQTEWQRSGGAGGSQDHADKPFIYQKELNNPKSASSSTFISHDGTLRRKMGQSGGQHQQAAKGRNTKETAATNSGSSTNTSSCKVNASGATLVSTAASTAAAVVVSAADKRKAESAAGSSEACARKKRKLSLQEPSRNDEGQSHPAKRKRSESVPEKQAARKSSANVKEITNNNMSTEK